MSEKIRAILDAVTDHVLAYRPKDKGLAAEKVRKQIERAQRKAKKDLGE